MSGTVDDASLLPKVIDPDDPSRRRPPGEMAHLVLYLTPEEVAAVEHLAGRRGMSVGELALRSLAYGLTVMEASRRELERPRPGEGEAPCRTQ